MTHKEGQKKITLEAIFTELQSFRTEASERFKKLDTELEEHFTAIQADLLELKTDVAQLKIDAVQSKLDVAGIKADLKEFKQEFKGFRAETNAFHNGFGMKLGRQDVFNFKLIGLLHEKEILSRDQSIDFRTA